MNKLTESAHAYLLRMREAECAGLKCERDELVAALQSISDETANCIKRCTDGNVSLLNVHQTVITVQIKASAALAKVTK